jgi:hypothetical protein
MTKNNTVKYTPYEITFKTNNKLHPTERKIKVDAVDEGSARYLTHAEFDSYKFDSKSREYTPTMKNITITEVRRIKDGANV